MYDQDFIDRVHEAWASSGKSVSSIALECGVSSGTACKWARNGWKNGRVQALRNECRDLLEKGHSHSYISEMLHIASQTVSTWARAWKIAPIYTQRRDQNEYRKRFEAGMSTSDIAVELNISVGHVRWIRKIMGYNAPPRRQPSRSRDAFNDLIQKAHVMYDNGMSVPMIAKELSVTRTLVRRWERRGWALWDVKSGMSKDMEDRYNTLAEQIANEARTEQYTRKELALAFGVTSEFVGKVIRVNGLSEAIRKATIGREAHTLNKPHKDKDGYLQVDYHTLSDADKHLSGKNGGNVYLHRLIMAQSIGRPVRKEEIVHHINGKKDDNRLDNLELVLRKDHLPKHQDLMRDFRRLRSSCKAMSKRNEELEQEAVFLREENRGLRERLSCVQ